MNLSQQTAKHFREIHFGGNWTCSNLKDTLADVTWQQAITQVHAINTIATLVFHVNYFVAVALKVLQDKLSFDLPPIQCQEDWDAMRAKALDEAEQFAALVEQMPESRFWEVFKDEKYGNYYRNIHGIIEHTHYHLGQIAVVKKILQQAAVTEDATAS
jgi:hypothetical protein